MLQQTRVDAVIERYERWLRRFPTLDDLARADTDDVLHEWQGLGYYARARNLHRAARVVREVHNGVVPADATALRALPGVGDYTAGAIASIAYGKREPAVDGNVRRVLCRLTDADLGARALRELAAELMPRKRPGEFNQALMELGATICAPRSPRCGECPLRDDCKAFAAGNQARRPAPKQRAAVRGYDVASLVVLDPDDRVLLRQRPHDGMLGGLWEFPGTIVRSARDAHQEVAPDDTVAPTGAVSAKPPAASLERGLVAAALATVADLLGDIAHGEPAHVGSLRHVFSHRIEMYHAIRVQLEEAPMNAPADRCSWTSVSEIAALALSTAQARLARLALTGGEDGSWVVRRERPAP